MESYGVGIAGLGAAGVATLGAFRLAFAKRRRRQRTARQGVAETNAISGPRTDADRLEALAAAQADLALRLDALAAQSGAPEERLQAMAGQLLGLVRDKNATLETALAGLDQLRARMRTLEQMGAPAEARALLETLQGRLDEVQAAQATGAAGIEAKLAALATPGGTAEELADRLARLQESRETGVETVLARLGPIETKLGALEAERAAERDTARDTGREALKRIEALQAEQGAVRTEIAGLRAEVGSGPVRALGEQLARLHAQKEALAEQLAGRIGALEAGFAARDPQADIERLAERLEARIEALHAVGTALGDRLMALEAPGEAPFAEISEQLTRLYAQKDATVETVFARLAPLEAKLAELAGRDPQAVLDGFATRLAALEAPGEAPFAEISEQLTRLYAQKDATVETVFARLAPLEAKLAEIAGRDPQGALDRFASRLEGFGDRLVAIEENPFADLSEKLTQLYAQKDATVEAVFARLAPLEAKLAEIAGRDPQSALDGFARELEAVRDRLAGLEAPGENPFGEISEQLTRLYAQKDATVETVFARLAPLEARLAEIDGRDPQTALDRFASRLEGFGDRLVAIEENPFAELSEKLTQLYTQRDATVETVFGRLAPIEAKLDALEGGLGRLAPLVEDDPRAAVEGLRVRLEALAWAQGEVAAGLAALKASAAEGGGFTEIADQLTRLYAQKDASVAALLARLAPLEARLAELEARPRDPEAGEADAANLAERLARLEAGLPRVDFETAATGAEPAAGDLDAIWTLPRIVSLHRKPN